MDDPKMESIIRRIKALLETRGCTEAEAEARMAKANELLEAYNLDMAILGKSGKGAQRSDTKKAGGLYSWQRKLWQAVAELNFCYYLSIRGLKKGSQYEHRLIGSHANVVSTEMMATYLQETIERLAQQWAKDNFYKSVFVREAIAYREGMAARIAERLRERRRQIVAEEERKQRERQESARADAAPSTNALTILDVISTEADFNNDYLNGWELGTTARNRAEREARAAAWRREHEAREAAKTPEQKEAERIANEKWWAEYWKKQERLAKRRKGVTRQRRLTAEEERMGLGSYWDGHRRGDEVSLDTQVDKEKRRAIARVKTERSIHD